MDLNEIRAWLVEHFPAVPANSGWIEGAARRLESEMRTIETTHPADFNRDAFLRARGAELLRQEVRFNVEYQSRERDHAARMMSRPLELLGRETPNEALPSRDDLDESIIQEQVRLLLPPSMRGRRYEAYVRAMASMIDVQASRLRPDLFQSLLRGDLEARGSMVRGAAPESLILSCLHRDMEWNFNRVWTEGEIADVRLELRARESARTSERPVHELVEVLRRAGRLVERR